MTPRLTSAIQVSALLRRVAAQGGFGAVLAKGDETAGALALVVRERGIERVLTRTMAPSGGYQWTEAAGGESIPAWSQRARARDPDLWIIELDIPDAARFVDETLP